MHQPEEEILLFDEEEAFNAHFDESAIRATNVLGNRQPVPIEAQRALPAIPDNVRPCHNYRIITDRLINKGYLKKIKNALFDALDSSNDIIRLFSFGEDNNVRYIEFQSTIPNGEEFFANVLNQFDANLQIVPGEQNIRLLYQGNIHIRREQDVEVHEDDILRRLRRQNNIDNTRVFVDYNEHADNNLSIFIDVASAGRIEELGRRIRLYEEDVDLTLVE